MYTVLLREKFFQCKPGNELITDFSITKQNMIYINSYITIYTVFFDKRDRKNKAL